MKKQIIINLALVLGIAVLVLYLNKPPTETVKQHSISAVKSATISSIFIYREQRETIHLVKKDIGWHIIQPIKAKANDVRISLLLDLLSTRPKSHFKLTHETDLHPFGLGSASLSVRLNDEEFQFGNIETLNKLRYVKHNEVVYLIKDTLAPLLNASAASFIDNRLVPSPSKISRLELPLLDLNTDKNNLDKLSMTLSDGHWSSNMPSLSSDTLVEIASSWQQAYAMQVIQVSEQSLQNLTGQKVLINYTNTPPSEFILQLSATNLSLINSAARLKYQFPIAMKHKLFVHTESN